MKIEQEPVMVNRRIIINKDDGDIGVMIADNDCVYWQSAIFLSDEEALACVAGILAGSFTPVGGRVELNTRIKHED